MMVMTWYAQDQRSQGGPVTGMGTILPPSVESSALTVETLSRGSTTLYYRTYTHHLWDGTTPITRVVYNNNKNYMWITNPVPTNPSNTLALWSTLGTVNIWNSQPLELALYAARMHWQLPPVTIVPIIDDPKQYVVPQIRHCVREIAELLRQRRSKLIIAWNNQDVNYIAVGNEGVSPDLIMAYQENADVYAFILHDHNGLRGDLGLTNLYEFSGRTDEEVNQYLDAQLAIATAQLGGIPVSLNYRGMFLNAENKISLDGIRIAYLRGCSQVRGLCRVRTSPDVYLDVYSGFVRSGDACLLVYPSTSGCGSSAALDGQNRWLFRAETKYVTQARYYAACVESLLQGILSSRIGEVSTWGHGINVAASRQGFIALAQQPAEGSTFTVSSGNNARTYEFRSTGYAEPGNIRVQIGLTLDDTAANLISAIAANQPDAIVYPKSVRSSDGYTMVLLTNYAEGEPIPITTTVPDATVEPIAERKVLLDYLVNSAFALADASDNQIVVLD
jgi:hypothetical protein